MTDQPRPQRDPRQLWLITREGQTRQQRVAEVAVRVRTLDLHSYAVPDELEASVQPGAPVRVPYGKQQRVVEGLCVRVSHQPWDQTRLPVLDADPAPRALPAPVADLGLWVASYYACSPWKTFAAVLPIALRRSSPRRVLHVHAAQPAPADAQLTTRQRALLEAIGGGEMPVRAALRRAGVGRSVLDALRRAGLVECVERTPIAEDNVAPADSLPESGEDRFDLTPAQQAAWQRIRDGADRFGVYLIFGVPGSGKTEVYVRAARDAVAAGRQVIILIPEIALATQAVDRLARRFRRVAVLHSQLSARVRRDTLLGIAAGQVDVALGTRSAVFAPCPRLGLIVVDEEQESSFKNLAAPYYHARDVAIKRGQLEGVPVVLGSATPSLETWHNASTRPHYVRLTLPERVPGAQVPRARRIAHDDIERLMSDDLERSLHEALAEGRQAILLHNRRGYAIYLRCTQCGLIVNCPRCDGHMVYHRPENVLKCHRCGGKDPVPSRCRDTSCGGPLAKAATAIQRLEEELAQRLPEARLLRLDRDTMRRRDDYRAALDRFEKGEADVLLGTQMVAKGLDFPRVKVVGVIDADAALALPDFRATERVFQLIMQVTGRAGRHTGESLALVQTARRADVIIDDALRMDYARFADRELHHRRRHGYPPFTRLVRFMLADTRPGRARDEARRLADALRGAASRIDAALRVDGPDPCIVRQVRGLLRYQVLVRGPRGDSVQRLAAYPARQRGASPRVQRFMIDVDPVDML